MTTPILTTKLFIPPLREDRLPRPQLIEKLNESTAYLLTLVSASAGSGKTTTLSEWAAHSERPVAWISLDGGDNDPAQFLTYFIAALRSIQEGFGEEALETLGSSQSDPLEMTLINLINETAEFPEKFTLVLDDYHLITDRRTNELNAFMVEHLPPQMHLVVTSRIDPPWPLARYRARGQLYEIRGQDLRFSADEAAAFLKSTMGLDLSAEDAAALEKRTEGWIAGLQLAALSMQGRDDIPGFVKEFTGSHLYVAEYLVEEILKQQTEELQSFLLRTSILERLSAGLCEAVSGCMDGQAILTRLQRANVFVIPLDHEGQWFRYHHLFADLLQARLQGAYAKEEIAKLHGSAANWYEQNGHLFEAVQHTLSAGDYEKAAVLVDQVGQTMVFSERHNILKNWLAALPDEAYMTHPRLEIYQLMIDLSRGTLDMYEQTLLEKEKLIKALPPSPENDRLRREALLNLALFYAFQNTSRAIQIAQEALENTPEGDLRLRPTLYSAFYRAYGMEGDIEKSAQAYRESLRLAEAAGQYGMISNTTMIRAFDLCQYGRLDEAAGYCRRVIEAGSGSKQRVFYPAGPAYIGLAGIHLERNDLEEAEDYLERGLELCHQGAMHGLFTGFVQKSRLHQAKGELEESMKVLENLLQTFQRREFTLMAREVAIRLAVGDTAGISGLVPTLLEILGESHYARQLPLIAAESFKLSLSRIYIAQGEIEQAAQLLDEIQATVEPGKRYGRLMEVHLLRALALRKQNPGVITEQTLDNLERALELGEAPGFVMLFLEEGAALVHLLKAFAGRRAAIPGVRDYTLKLLHAFGEADAQDTPVQEAAELVEQLTAREMEVLALVAAGDSNQTIAEKLVITVRTVKKHTSNIYGKLNASSRTQAVARARELGLLPIDH